MNSVPCKPLVYPLYMKQLLWHSIADTFSYMSALQSISFPDPLSWLFGFKGEVMRMRLFCTQLQDVLTWNSGFPAIKGQRGFQKSTSASIDYATRMRPNKAQKAVYGSLILAQVIWLGVCNTLLLAFF